MTLPHASHHARTTHAPRTHTTRRITHACLTSISHNSATRQHPIITNISASSWTMFWNPHITTQCNIIAILSFPTFNAYIHVYKVQVTTTMSRINAMHIPLFPSEDCDTITPVDDNWKEDEITLHEFPHCNSCCPLIGQQFSHVALPIGSFRYTRYSSPSRDFT
jgi:hypothetical protein